MPAIACVDIETSPTISAVWQRYQSDTVWVVEHSSIICWSVKYLNGKQITKALPDYAGYEAGGVDDKALVTELWHILDKLQIAVGHNGDRFDFPKINARFIRHGLPPINPFKTVDTKKMAKRTFGFFSNKLDEIGEFLGVGRKISTGGYSLWKDCLAGDMKAWRLMKKYNAQDVKLLEAVYLKLRPYDKRHPNLNVYFEREQGCPTCGSPNIIIRGYSDTPTGRAVKWQCQEKDCGKYSTGKHFKVAEVR